MMIWRDNWQERVGVKVEDEDYKKKCQHYDLKVGFSSPSFYNCLRL